MIIKGRQDNMQASHMSCFPNKRLLCICKYISTQIYGSIHAYMDTWLHLSIHMYICMVLCVAASLGTGTGAGTSTGPWTGTGTSIGTGTGTCTGVGTGTDHLFTLYDTCWRICLAMVTMTNTSWSATKVCNRQHCQPPWRTHHTMTKCEGNPIRKNKYILTS